MYIAPIVLRHPEVYSKFQSTAGGQVKILDNGNYETKQPCSLEDLFKAADIVGATELVLPDDLFDAERTLYFTRRALWDLAGRNLEGRRLMAVAQGSTWQEVMYCAFELATMHGVHTVGLPKYMSNPDFPGNDYGVKGRIIAAYKLWRSDVRCVLHFMGCAQGTAELCGADLRGIRSMDTSLWMMYARKDLHIDTARPKGLEADIERDKPTFEQVNNVMVDMEEFLSRGCLNAH